MEKDGRARELPLDRVCAVRANAHYTYIHDGETEFFCTQSISALEAMLDARAFMRVHRSHIVRIAAVARPRRHGNSLMLDMGAPVRCSIPVARAQQREVKRRLEAIDAADEPLLVKCVSKPDAFRAHSWALAPFSEGWFRRN